MLNKNEILNLISLELIKNPDLQGGAVDLKEIQEIEKKLSKNFSNQYKNFIEKYGCAIIQGMPIYGLKFLSIMGDKLNTVLENTKFYLDQKWPGIDNWYIISDDGMGNPIGIDPEGKVWLSDHDCDFELIKLADSFEEFLCKVYTDTIYE